MNSKELFAHRLNELRTERGLSLNELAEALKTTSQSLSMYERAERTANIELLAKAAKYFNVSTDYLMGFSNNRNDKPSSIADITVGEAAELTEKLTGLNQNTISAIASLNMDLKEYVEVINVFFEKKENVVAFLAGLFDLASYSYVSLKCNEDFKTQCYYGSKANAQRYRLHHDLECLLNVYDYGELYSVTLAPYAEVLLSEVREGLKNGQSILG